MTLENLVEEFIRLGWMIICVNKFIIISPHGIFKIVFKIDCLGKLVSGELSYADSDGYTNATITYETRFDTHTGLRAMWGNERDLASRYWSLPKCMIKEVWVRKEMFPKEIVELLATDAFQRW